MKSKINTLATASFDKQRQKISNILCISSKRFLMYYVLAAKDFSQHNTLAAKDFNT